MNLEPKALADRMVKEWEYKPKQVEETVGKILDMDAEILAAFQAWDGSEPLPDLPNVHGYTPRVIHQAFQLKPPACFLLLDWVKKEPSHAMTALMTEYGKAALRVRVPAEKGK